MNERKPPKKENKFLSDMKKGFDKFAQKTGEGLQKLGEKTGKFMKDAKDKTKNKLVDMKKGRHNIYAINRKKRETKDWNRFTKKPDYKMQMQTQKRLEEVESKQAELKQDTSVIMQDTNVIKQDTAQIKEELKKMFSLLEVLDYKADKVDEILNQYLPKLEEILDGIGDIETYLKEQLGSKWKKLRNQWEGYKDGEISKGQFISAGLKTLGGSFLRLFKARV